MLRHPAQDHLQCCRHMPPPPPQTPTHPNTQRPPPHLPMLHRGCDICRCLIHPLMLPVEPLSSPPPSDTAANANANPTSPPSVIVSKQLKCLGRVKGGGNGDERWERGSEWWGGRGRERGREGERGGRKGREGDVVGTACMCFPSCQKKGLTPVQQLRQLHWLFDLAVCR